MGEKYDFHGVATQYNIRCKDGLTLRTGAFKGCTGEQVPLMWNHKHDSIDNVLGHAVLDEQGEKIIAHCKFNDTEMGQKAKRILQNGDIGALSIFATDLSRRGNDVIHGAIREVSLVLTGANPCAEIDKRSIAHSMGIDLSDPEIDDILDDLDMAQIYHGIDGTIELDDVYLAHSDDDDYLSHADDDDDDDKKSDGKTWGQKIYDTLNDDQKSLFIAMLAQSEADKDDDDEDEEKEDEVKHSYDDLEGGEELMHYNAFDQSGTVGTFGPTKAEVDTILKDAKRYGSLKESLKHHLEDEDGILAHAYPTNEDGSEQTYGIADINWLFPEARALSNTPEFIKRDQDWVAKLMNGTKHTPFSRVKTVFADITEDEARARGYMKGKKKIEEVFTLLKRSTDPQTVYKKQKFDRDDIIDITDFDVVAWVRQEMRMMLNEEIARAVLVGDGRSTASDDKISEDHIRSIYHDDDLFAIKVPVAISATADDTTKAKAVIRAIKKARKDYKGSGNPIYFTTEDELSNMLLLEDGDGYFMFKTDAELATVLRVREIVTVPVMEGLSRTEGSDTFELAGILVNPADYNIGADRGGEIANFEDFDIDYNQYKYLIETRISGALIKPKSALVVEYTTAAG